jgi:hypothetical protein
MLHKQAFRLTHALADNPLFRLEALVGVAQEAAKRRNDIYADVGEVGVADKWGNIPRPDLPASEVIGRIETAGAWIVLKHVETNPKYKAALDECTAFVRELAGPEGAKLLHDPELIVLITSPNRLTPYHFDPQINFLAQLQGSKDVWVCDPLDRALTTEEELERYYAVTITAGNYKAEAEEKATKFVLSPGEAIHIPTHGAHWVKNHDNVSVSVSLNFEFPKWMYHDVYLANHFIRRIGLTPWPPGKSALADGVKSAVVSTARSVKHFVSWCLNRGR